VISSSTLSIQDATAQQNGGGFIANDEIVIDRMSNVSIFSSRAKQGGGFLANEHLHVSTGSRLIIRNAKAGQYGGGFYVHGRTLISSSTMSISRSSSGRQGGGFQTKGRLQVTNGAFLNLEDVTTGSIGGAFIVSRGEVEIAGNSTVKISNSRAKSGDGGGCYIQKGLNVSTGSRLVIWNAEAGEHGGAFRTGEGLNVSTGSRLIIRNAKAGKQSGGFQSGRLQVTDGSFLNLEDVTAGSHGGAFVSLGEVEIAGNSTVNISNSRAESGYGGGCYIEKGLNVSTGSRLTIRNAEAQDGGGGFYAKGETLISTSTLSIQDARARQLGGGFLATGRVVINASTVDMFSTYAGANGGAFAVIALSLHTSSMSISNSTALGSGSGGHADGQVLLSAQSTLVVKHAKGVVKHAQGPDTSSVLFAGCFHMLDRSHMLFEDVAGGHGVELQNSGCSAHCSNSTFHVAEDAALNASGRLSSGFLSLAACPKEEEVRLSGIHLHSWSSALLSTRPSYVVVDQVSVEYKPPVNNMQVLAAKDGLRVPDECSARQRQICKPTSR